MRVKVYGADLSAWVAAACLARSGNQVIIEGPDALQTQPLEEIPRSGMNPVCWIRSSSRSPVTA